MKAPCARRARRGNAALEARSLLAAHVHARRGDTACTLAGMHMRMREVGPGHTREANQPRDTRSWRATPGRLRVSIGWRQRRLAARLHAP